MAPKAISQATIERLIMRRVNATVEAERVSQVNARRQGGNANEAGDQDASYENSLQSQIHEGSNSGDDDNTGNGGKIVGGAIGAHGSGIGDSLLVALYACMTFIYGSSWEGEMASKAKISLDKSSEGSEKVSPGEAGK
ncbi:hypothetical protein Tco_0992638 [Tanacetum coccineum]|uniref:Uncharacterized protein n=1 Tax=Tanacetum coccineum TaxID=301880 RepID=A0ABQ5F362_9ASTR